MQQGQLAANDAKIYKSCGRFCTESYPRYVEPLVQQCMEWCDSYALPLVVPLTTWLPDPRPALVTTVAVSDDVVRLCPTISSQHVFCADGSEHVISMYHVPTSKHIRTFTGDQCYRPGARFSKRRKIFRKFVIRFS